MNFSPKTMPKRRVDHAASVRPLSYNEKAIEDRDEKPVEAKPTAVKAV